MLNQVISNQFLFDTYLTKHMENYFYTKLKDEDKSYVKLKIAELLKFLILSHHTFGDIPFNEEIDEMWHLWILQTIQYRELMDKLPTQRFIHHSSNDYQDEKNSSGSAEDELNKQVSFLASYVLNFGKFTQETIIFWPVAKQLMKVLHFDLEALNQFVLLSGNKK